MKPLNFSLVKLSLCLIVGILMEFTLDLPILYCLTLSTFLLIILTVLFFVNKKSFNQNSLFAIVVFLITISIGSSVYKLHDDKIKATHYSNFQIQDTLSHQFIIQIKERLKPGKFYEKYIVEVSKIDGKEASGKLLLNVSKDSLAGNFHTDDIIIGISFFKTLIDPFNPNQFSYKNYLAKQQIFNQLFADEVNLVLLQSKPVSISGYADRLRRHLNIRLKDHAFSYDQMSLINALFLGQRQEIDTEIYQNYSNAGAVHILAISGLHIGIVLLIFQTLLKPLERFKKGSLIKTLIIVLLLWSFAFIAGLSASVTRAVTMFTVFAVALNLKRPHNVYNTLAISVFLILLFKPRFLFDVGFQLSYLAVLGIVSVQPMLFRLMKRPKSWVVNKYWETLTVTLAAQFGILPLSLFYFHKFPLLFLLSNLVIIPLLGILLGFGLLVIFLSTLSILPEFIASVFGKTIDWMNYFVAWVANHENFILKGIPFGILELITGYLAIVLMILFFKMPNGKRAITLLLSIIIFQATCIYSKKVSRSNEFIVFHKSRFSLIGESRNGEVNFYHNLENLEKERIFEDYIIGNYTKSIKEDSIKPIYEFNSKIILLVDSLGIYQVKSVKPNILLLINSPKINLERVIDSIQPEQIIADGSNFKSYVERWKGTCQKRKIPFHNTNEKGAFVLRNSITD